MKGEESGFSFGSLGFGGCGSIEVLDSEVEGLSWTDGVDEEISNVGASGLLVSWGVISGFVEVDATAPICVTVS